MATRKCVICNEILDEQGVQYKGRYAHQKCFNIAMKTLQKEKNREIDKVAEKKKVGRKAKPKAEVVTAFTGLLELTRRSKVTASQEELFGDIVVQKSKRKEEKQIEEN